MMNMKANLIMASLFFFSLACVALSPHEKAYEGEALKRLLDVLEPYLEVRSGSVDLYWKDQKTFRMDVECRPTEEWLRKRTGKNFTCVSLGPWQAGTDFFESSDALFSALSTVQPDKKGWKKASITCQGSVAEYRIANCQVVDVSALASDLCRFGGRFFYGLECKDD